MDWLIAILGIMPVLLALVWWHRRRKIARGLLCWNCGADLRGRSLSVDFRGQSRCPKCGDLLDVTDVYQLPR
jgi:hypothetical protein